MLRIEDIDKNFAVNTDCANLVFYNAENKPFTLHGVMRDENMLVRMPRDVASTVSTGVAHLNKHTAGGRIRFRTNSKRIGIAAKMHAVGKMPHFALTGSAGFDLFREDPEGADFIGTYQPKFDITDRLTGCIATGEGSMNTYTLNMPLYSGILELFIGIEPGASLEEAEPYRNARPVVYYGSSITQGGCASKPGDSYQAIVSRELKLDYINLGFSGNAKAEESIANYISNLDMSIFVYDYDHNAPNPDHLLATHERMFLTIRQKNPDLPIIMMSRPRYHLTQDTARRLEIIKSTYERAVEGGDKNVYLITGRELTAICRNNGSVDGTHPTSFGFYSMAQPLLKIIDGIINNRPDVLI